MVTTLYLVRHGSIEEGGARRYYGSMDVPLLEKGVEQMKGACGLITRYLADLASAKDRRYLNDIHDPEEAGPTLRDGRKEGTPRLTAIYCSDLQRAVRSAEIIAEPYGLDPIQLPALRERNFGIWEGLTFTEIKERYPLEFEAWAANPLKHNPVGGESTHDMGVRVTHAIENIVESHLGEEIAIIAHGGVNRIVLCQIMGIPLENIFRIEQDYGAVNIVEFWDRYPVVKLVNGRLYG
ncbi:MAG TPA: histidine phosphatase family protein [Syntrophorhabdales bacterium]|nr:histidine phosphatase family protein [Syntrophorhabdales bacterium]